jgi:hemerythrin-like metal-binding protein
MESHEREWVFVVCGVAIMGFFNWGRKSTVPDHVYSVMNDDHAALYRILAELREGIATQPNGETERGFQRAILLSTARKLIDKAREHFQREEALMAAYGYPEIKAHRSEHLMLLRTVETYHATLASSHRPITGDVAKYFKAWLTNHIRTADRRLDRFLVSAASATGKVSLVSRGDLNQGGEASWTAENTLLWATLQDCVSKETVGEHRRQTTDTIQDMQIRQKREQDRLQRQNQRRKAATVARQVRALFFE